MKNKYKLILNKQAEMDKEAVVMLFPALMTGLSALSIYDASKSIPRLYRDWKRGAPLAKGAIKVGMDVAGALPLIGGAAKGLKVAGSLGGALNLWKGGKHFMRSEKYFRLAQKALVSGNKLKHTKYLKIAEESKKLANLLGKGVGYNAAGVSNLMNTGLYGKYAGALRKGDNISGFSGMGMMLGSFAGHKPSREILNYGYDAIDSTDKVIKQTNRLKQINPLHNRLEGF